MDKFWKLATCALLVFSISMVIGSNNLSNQIEELQTTVTRQSNAIQQLEKEKNNVETIDWEQRRYEIAKDYFLLCLK